MVHLFYQKGRGLSSPRFVFLHALAKSLRLVEVLLGQHHLGREVECNADDFVDFRIRHPKTACDILRNRFDPALQCDLATLQARNRGAGKVSRLADFHNPAVVAGNTFVETLRPLGEAALLGCQHTIEVRKRTLQALDMRIGVRLSRPDGHACHLGLQVGENLGGGTTRGTLLCHL